MRTPLWGALGSVGLLAACLAPVSLLSPSGSRSASGSGTRIEPSFPSDTVEWGSVDWQRDLDVAMNEAVDTGKPVMLLFQEVPG